MNRPEHVEELLDTFQHLYPTADHAALIASMVGLDRMRIAFGGSARQFWLSILKEAEQQGKVRELVQFAAGDYPHNSVLQQWLNQTAPADERSSAETHQDEQVAARQPEPVKLFISYSRRDVQYREEMERHLAPLLRQGGVHVWSDNLLAPGENWQREIDRQLRAAHVILVLVSPDYLASETAQKELNKALAREREAQARVLPVIVRPSVLKGSRLAEIQWLPSDGRAITTWRSRDEAWVDVVEGIRRVVDLIARAGPQQKSSSSESIDEPIKTGAPSDGPSEAAAVPAVRRADGRAIGEIFRVGRQPDATFVEPEQFPLLRAHLRTMGVGLVVAGPSGIGKTTAVNKAREKIADGFPVTVVHALSSAQLSLLDQALTQGFIGHLVVDDFHHLDSHRKRQIAVAMKVLADRNATNAKITVIGINAAGASLVHELDDLGSRLEEVFLTRQSDERIDELIGRGEVAANVVFRRRDEFVTASAGSFSAAQQLCFHGCVLAGVESAAATRTVIDIGVRRVLGSLVSKLDYKYRSALLSFSAHDRSMDIPGACLALLWLIGQDRERSQVILEDAGLQYPELRPTLGWLQDGGLAKALAATPKLTKLLHFETGTTVLSADDPLLVFYLRNLDWPTFARKSTTRQVSLDGSGVLVFNDRPSRRPRHATQKHEERTDGMRSTARLPAGKDGSDPWVLHLSDLHFQREEQAVDWYNQLAEDLRDVGCDQPNMIVLSGDITDRATEAEYSAAHRFLERLMDEFSLSSHRLVIVPGNHDVDWEASRRAYPPKHRSEYRGELIAGHYIAEGSFVAVRDEDLYRRRFAAFSAFYQALKGEPYPFEYAEQGIVQHLPEERLLVVGLNSAWQLDHHYTGRASVHSGAVSQVLAKIRRNEAEYGDCLRLAVWHHPLAGMGDDRIKDTGFLEQLAKAGFRIGLHGHVHQAKNDLFRYDMMADGRRLDLVCAGTFGAPTDQWVPGYPLGYNLLQIGAGKVTVHTRRREEINGAWKPDARWLTGPKADPLPRYEINR